jgi:iron complex transport system ATP-binding protein
MIQLKNIHFTYPDGPKVLEGVSFDVRPHEILGVLGPNGSGKTTVLKLMLGLLTPTAGSIELNKHPLKQLSHQDIAQRICHVPQTDGIELDFTVWDIVMMGRQPYQRLFGFDSAEDRHLALAALEATETESLNERSIQSLSGGERRRVLIARALVQNTASMLLDEPIAHLDIHYQLEISELLLRLRNERKRSIVVTLHDINLASLYCDRILLLSDRKIYGIGKPDEVISESSIKDVFGAAVAVEYDEESGRPYYRLLRKTS